MSATAGERGGDPHELGHDDTVPISERGPAPKRIVVAYGFWIFLLSDFILFSGFFAAYFVLSGATAGGPGGRDLFDLPLVATETIFLLLSSFACGMAGIATMARNKLWFQVAMGATGLLGAGFLALELSEFAQLISAGHGPQRSAFLSAFFALVGCHGLHVLLGLVWLTTMMAQVWAKGFRDDILRRITCFALFWHALDIIWVALFTSVYLLGTVR
ncbi:cytochrome (ubi)quinol oxidase subunit III [Sphingomonas hylomeconis]|uniref:Cytochrome (Ubi)quinol oxidase subunit III n=1 Tax=Sphingomonas hylomeconis TaxID=1395958 RepID=A0ABV7SRI9_9SPHN|nr:cytochrome (ubi)quinol oxidase subunit III [Sphingomonas hylomeconis]